MRTRSEGMKQLWVGYKNPHVLKFTELYRKKKLTHVNLLTNIKIPQIYNNILHS